MKTTWTEREKKTIFFFNLVADSIFNLRYKIPDIGLAYLKEPPAMSSPKAQKTRKDKEKERDKERKLSQPDLTNERLKTVVRRLPPNLPEDIFWQSVQPWVTEDTTVWKTYYAGKIRKRYAWVLFRQNGFLNTLFFLSGRTRRISHLALISLSRRKNSWLCSAGIMMGMFSGIKQVRYCASWIG